MLKILAITLVCVGLIVVVLGFAKAMTLINNLESRVIALERKTDSTIEIVVERAYDEDMGVYDYKLIAVKEEK